MPPVCEMQGFVVLWLQYGNKPLLTLWLEYNQSFMDTKSNRVMDTKSDRVMDTKSNHVVNTMPADVLSKMPRYVFVVAALLVSLVSSAQTGARYVMNMDEWYAGKWSQLASVSEETRSKGKQLWSGGGDIQLTTGDNDRDWALKNNVFVVQTDTATYVSLKGLKSETRTFGKNFTRAWVMPDSSLVFAFHPVGKKESARVAPYAMFGMAGAIGVGIQMHRIMKDKIIYFITREGGKNVIRADKDYIDNLLNPWPDIKASFDSKCGEEGKYNAADALECLARAGLITKTPKQ